MKSSVYEPSRLFAHLGLMGLLVVLLLVLLQVANVDPQLGKVGVREDPLQVVSFEKTPLVLGVY